MRKPSHIPRTASEARKRGHKKITKKAAATIVRAQNSHVGTHLSSNNANPGDVAWIGPCEASGTRIICYYDQNMDPSDCKDVPC